MGSPSLARFLSVAAFVACTASSSAALATPDGDLAVAENAYTALDYSAAASSADQLLAQRGLSHDVLKRATRVAALSHAALGHADVAKQHFIALLQYDPDLKVDTKLGPRFSEPFSEARGYWQAQGRRPSMEVQATVHQGQPGQIKVTTVDPLGSVKKVLVGYRWAPARDYTLVTMDPGARSTDLPSTRAGGGRLDYYVRGVDAKDSAVFEEGTPESPKSVTLSEPGPRSSGSAVEQKKGLGAGFWLTTGGLVLAGAAVASIFAFRPTEYTPATTGRGVIGASCGGARCD